MPTQITIPPNEVPINSTTTTKTEIVNISLSDTVVNTSIKKKKKYNSYFVTKGKVNLDIIENNLLSSVKEFQLYQFLHAIDNKKDIIDIKYANVYYINSGNGITMIPLLRLGIYMVSAKMHNIFNDGNLLIKQTNEKINTKTSIKILDIQINKYTKSIKKPTVLQKNINYNTWWLVHVSKESKIPENDKSKLIDFITIQFDTIKPDEMKYLNWLVTRSEKIILYFFEFDKDRPYADIKACMLYTTTEEGAFIHYLCVHSLYRSFGIGTFMMLILQSQLNFRGKKMSLHLQANNTTSAYRYYNNINFCKTQEFPKCIEEVLDKKLFDKLEKMTLTDNISGRSYFSLPDNIQICKTKNNEMLPLETIALKDHADSKTFFVFPFNFSGHEIENMLSKHDFCWLHWDGFYEKDF